MARTQGVYGRRNKNSSANNQYNVGDYYGRRNGYMVWDGESFKWKGKQKGSGRLVSDPNKTGSTSSSSEDNGVNTPSGALRYPIDFTAEPSTQYVKFTFWKYKDNKGQLSGGGTIGSDNYYNDESLYEQAGGFPQYIIVNMPQDINTQFGAQWGGKQFGFLSKKIAKAGGELASGDIGGTFKAFGEIVEGTIKDGSEAAKAAASAAIVAGINKIPGVGGNLTMNDLVQGSTSKILNPNVELMYEGPTLRTLALNMKLFAREEGETNTILEIGKSFRKAAVPSGQSNRFIRVPPLIQVEFMQGGSKNENLPQYRRFAITAVQVNFTPDGQYVAYVDGKLPAIEIALELQETKIIFAEDVDKGF